VPGLPVDRHVLRVANRIGIASSHEPERVEAALCAALPQRTWTLASDVQILHGRRICRPKPHCGECSVRTECDYFRGTGPTDGSPPRQPARPRAERAGTGAKPTGSMAGTKNDARSVRTSRH
jgi:endonuclease-3